LKESLWLRNRYENNLSAMPFKSTKRVEKPEVLTCLSKMQQSWRLLREEGKLFSTRTRLSKPESCGEGRRKEKEQERKNVSKLKMTERFAATEISHDLLKIQFQSSRHTIRYDFTVKQC
jgi:hypothetical protein